MYDKFDQSQPFFDLLDIFNSNYYKYLSLEFVCKPGWGDIWQHYVQLIASFNY